MRTTIGAAMTAGAFVFATSNPAHAGGFEYPENGSLAMGRGGAFVARASDPTALIHNTAGIVGLDGLQVTVSSNFAILNNCFQRGSVGGMPGTPGTYPSMNDVSITTDGTVFSGSNFANGSTAYPRVCNNGSVFPAPQVLATYRFNRYFAMGIGVYGPNSVGQQDFPTTVQTSNGLAPSPIRYMLLDENLLIIHPTIAFAAAPVPWLRLGIAFQPSVASFSFTTMANAVSTQSPDADIKTSISASGFFIAGNAGLQVVLRRYFTAGLHVHYNPDHINMTGTGHAIFNPYASSPSGMVNSDFTVTQMRVGLPTQVKFGGRFALPRTGSVNQWDPHYDPMRDDVFDVEVNWNYEHASAFDALNIQNSGAINVGINVPAPSISVPHNWSDIWGVRVGGDWNVIADRLALRLGVSYETGAQNQYTGQIDVPSYNTLGVHGGLSVRYHWLTVSAAYAHLFMQDFDVVTGTSSTGPTANVHEIGAMGPVTSTVCNSAGQDACGINVGHYSASLDVFNIGFTGHF